MLAPHRDRDPAAAKRELRAAGVGAAMTHVVDEEEGGEAELTADILRVARGVLNWVGGEQGGAGEGKRRREDDDGDGPKRQRPGGDGAPTAAG
eukprot:gene1610-18264_t